MHINVWRLTTAVSLSNIFHFEIVMCFLLVLYVRITCLYKANVIKNENEIIEFRQLSRGEVPGVTYALAWRKEGVY